ncbi:NAD-binding protein [Mucisphaera calidilacus]|uniref:NAD-binding protein n=1 Tax=Mucisphaera calidilacus TaxID=2527982 RepID=UPI001F26D978|nr:NAD(P)-binding protein [Mucisphaera calidilacus]
MTDTHSTRSRAIVAGYGPVGRLVAERLEASGFEVVIVELNLDTIERQLDLDRRIVYGCATDPDTLRIAGIEAAQALALTIPDEKEVVRACRVARSLNPGIRITARTNFVSQGLQAKQAGADAVIIEEIVTAEAMRDAVLQAMHDEASGI